MCAAEADCGSRASCVAGRCVAHGATAAIDTARRLLFFPVDLAYMRRDANLRDATTATLGRARDGGAVVFLRFSVALPPEANVLEAYLVLERAIDIDADPTPVAMRAVRIVDPWDGRTASWARQPRVEEVGAPVTRVSPVSGPLVRLDVRALVQRWRRRGAEDFGVAVAADEESSTGIAFALVPAVGAKYDPNLATVEPLAPPGQSSLESHAASPSSVAQPGGEVAGPRLELYLK
jgi:hypothetical protein